MEYQDFERATIWLDSFALSDSAKRRLIEQFGGVVNLVKKFKSAETTFQEFKAQDCALYPEMLATLSGDGYYRRVMEKLEKANVVPIVQGSELYPSEWAELPDKPLVVYAQGDITLLKKRKIAVCGSRRTPPAALKLTETVCRELGEELTVVTGASDGADLSALGGAMQGVGKAICFLAGGLSSLPQTNVTLFEKVKKQGLILAPCREDVSVKPFSFEYRNKLLAALCESVFIVGAGEKSGALITAKYAEKFKKPILAFPYSPNAACGEGCNGLIKRGAKLVENAEDVLFAHGLEKTARQTGQTLSETEQKVFESLRERPNAHVSELAAATGIPTYKITAILSSLEVKGCVVRVGGNAYSAV